MDPISRPNKRVALERSGGLDRRLFWLAFAIGVAVPAQAVARHRPWGGWTVFYALVAIVAARVLVVDHLQSALKRRRGETSARNSER